MKFGSVDLCRTASFYVSRTRAMVSMAAVLSCGICSPALAETAFKATKSADGVTYVQTQDGQWFKLVPTAEPSGAVSASAKSGSGSAEVPAPATALDADSQNPDEPGYVKQYQVPGSPAAAILGFSPDEVVDVGTPQDFFFGTISGALDGKLAEGLAFSWRPFQREEEEGVLNAIVNRLQITAAGIRSGNEDEEINQASLGVNLTVADSEDLLNAYLRDKSKHQLDARAREALESYLDSPAKNSWLSIPPNKDSAAPMKLGESLMRNSALAIGAAQGWASDAGEWDMHENGFGTWMAYKYVPYSHLQVRLSGIYTNDLKTSAFPEAGDTLGAVASVRVGGQDLYGFLSGNYETFDGETIDDEFYSVNIGVAKRLRENAYFQISYKKEYDKENGENDELIVGGLKFGWDFVSGRFK